MTRPKGFSLIEVMISGVLFLLTLGGVLTAFQTSVGLFAHYEHETAAIHIAESILEDLLLRGRSDPELTDGTTTSHRYDDEGDLVAGARFTGAWTVTGSTPIPGLRTVDLIVSWTEDGTPRRIRMTTVRE